MNIPLQNLPLAQKSAVQKIFTIFAEQNIQICLVGGFVRDTLLGIETTDIDMAVSAPPDDVIQILRKAYVKVVLTGYKFGTVTAIVDKQTIQITSLRKEHQHNGRHAQVVYGTNWKEDASRRDFTINALYANNQGEITDFFDGIQDLKSGIIRFIGDAHHRIQEDYLRILRYFRFLAWYGNLQILPDKKAVKACADLRMNLQNLSRERIGQEFIKLLAAPAPFTSVALMEKCGVLSCIFHEKCDLAGLKQLGSMEKIPSSFLRLAALCLPGVSSTHLAEALRLSKHQKNYLKKCAFYLALYPFSHQTTNRILYEHGPDFFLDVTCLGIVKNSHGQTKTDAKKAYKMACLASTGQQSRCFPLAGKDLVEAGLTPGPDFGFYLKKCEMWWIDQDFKPDKETCLKWILKIRDNAQAQKAL
jgi:poly(A) polymerase